MQWKCLPVPKDQGGNPEIHFTTVYKAFAKSTDDGSLEGRIIRAMLCPNYLEKRYCYSACYGRPLVCQHYLYNTAPQVSPLGVLPTRSSRSRSEGRRIAAEDQWPRSALLGPDAKGDIKAAPVFREAIGGQNRGEQSAPAKPELEADNFSLILDYLDIMTYSP
jgi:hypothetical protein